MMQKLKPEVRDIDRATDDDDLNHYTCCNESRAMCGADLANAIHEDFDDVGPSMCLVCRDLDARDCERCGR